MQARLRRQGRRDLARQGRNAARLLAIAVLALSLTGVSVASPSAGPARKKTGAYFHATQAPDPGGGCHGGVGIVVDAVPGAVAYHIEYLDTGRVVPADVTVNGDLQTNSAPLRKRHEITSGQVFVGVTGGWGSGPCGKGKPDNSQGGRFTGTPKAWAIFPPDYKPKPSIKVEVTTPEGGILVGDTTEVKVKVTSGETSLSGVSVKGLDGGGDLAEITKRPKGTSGFSLPSGGSRIFSFTVKGLAQGAVDFSASATGKSKKGSVSGSGSGTLRIARESFALTIGTTPQKVRLKVDGTGKIEPQDVTVTVRLSNPNDKKIENVTLQAVDPRPVDRTQTLDQLALPRGSLPVDFGTIAPRSHVAKTFKLKVTGDGKYELDALATFETPSGGTGRVDEIGGQFESIVPPLFFKPTLEHDNLTDGHDHAWSGSGPAWVKGGNTWYIQGTLKNESSYKRLCIAPLTAKAAANAAATGMIDTVQKGLRNVGGAYAGALAPGKDVALEMFVDTSAEGGTKSQISLDPQAAVIGAAATCNDVTFKSATRLTAADATIPDPGGDFDVHVDVSVPPPLPASKAAFAGGVVLGVVGSFFVETVKQAIDLVALAHTWASTELEWETLHPGFPPGSGIAEQIAIRSAQAIQTASQVYGAYWASLSAEQKSNLFKGVWDVVKQTGGDFYTEGESAVQDAVAPWANQVEKAASQGDDQELGKLWGQAAGSALSQIVFNIFLEKAGAAIVADAAGLDEKAAQAAKEWEQGDARAAIDETDAAAAAGEEAQAAEQSAEARAKEARQSVESGTPVDQAEKQSIWGIDVLSDALFKRISEKYKVLIGVRDRAIQAVKELDLGSVWKHENLKPKSVNEIDVRYLGFRDSDLAQLRLRTYTDAQVAEITDRVRNATDLTAEQKVAILDRFETRLHESRDYLDKIQAFSRKGEINVGFNYRENGISKATTQQIRKFHLDSEAAGKIGDVSAGGEYYTPLQENLDLRSLRKLSDKELAAKYPNCRKALGSVLCTVTGDVDGVYITEVDGSAVPKDVLVKIYDELAAAGWQHPETLTWIDNQGRFIFGAKADILAKLGPKGQAIVEYAPDGVTRAVRLNPGQSTLLGRDNFRLSVLGGYHEPVNAAKNVAAAAAAK